MTLNLGRGRDGRPVGFSPEALRTHGVIVGMTGSGKTGMGLVLLEELVSAGVPVLAIDPKGDIGNLGLVFPQGRPDDFAPWADGQDPTQLASAWTAGQTGQEGRAAALADKLALTIYTPGSEAGVPVDVLGALRRPDAAVLADDEARVELVADTVSGLLGLVGRHGDPVRDPAHVVLATILEAAWSAGEDPDLEALLGRLVDPPFAKVGVFPVDRFFPPDDRMELAMKLNAVLASPSFAAWTKGAALDVDALLKPGPKVPVSVFSIAHLSDDERQFFLGMFLGRLLAWTRSQPGTERLRAVLFFDEAAGYIPPHPADPPTKRPLMMLMKQARAMGLGVVLATQNPVDLDYKALSNAGLWLVGRLRTEQDRARVLQGVPGEGLDALVAGLQKREFLMVQASGTPTVLGSRHTLCWLRGPFTRNEIRSFVASPLHAAAAPVRVATAPSSPAPVSTPSRAASSAPPPAGLPTRWLSPSAVFSARLEGALTPWAEPATPVGRLRPAVLGVFDLRFDDEKVGFVKDETVWRLWFPLDDGLPDAALELPFTDADFSETAPASVAYDSLPGWLDEAKELAALRKQVEADLVRRETTGTLHAPGLKLHARGDEDAAAFQRRVDRAVKDEADAQIAALRDKVEAKADKVQEKLRRAEQKQREAERTASARQAEEVMNVGETLLSWFTGRKKSVSSAVTKRRLSSSASTKAESAQADVEALHEEMAGLAESLEAEIEQIRAEVAAKGAVEPREVGLEKADAVTRWFGIVWVPVTRRV